MWSVIENIKWWFFKRKLFKINRKNGGDFDGDVVHYKGRMYYVNKLTKEVRILTRP